MNFLEWLIIAQLKKKTGPRLEARSEFSGKDQAFTAFI